MLGNGILVAPILYKGAKDVDVYFTQGKWYDFYNYAPIERDQESKDGEKGFYKKFPVVVNQIPLFLRGGHIITVQEPALNTVKSRKNEYSLIVVLDENMKAKGEVYIDDGESLKSEGSLIKFEANMKIKEFFSATGKIEYFLQNGIKEIVFIGIQESIRNQSVLSKSEDGINSVYLISDKNNTLVVKNPVATLTTEFSLNWN